MKINIWILWIINLLSQTSIYSQVQTRYFETYYLDAPEYRPLYRKGDELGKLLIQGVKEGNLQAYKMSSYAVVQPFSPEFVNGSLLNRHDSDAEVLEWEASEPWYYGDIVIFEGLEYITVRDHDEAHPPGDNDYWELSPRSIINPRDLIQIKLDFTAFGDITIPNFIHFWYYDPIYDEDYYLISFSVDECLGFLASLPIPLYRDLDPTLGWVAGTIFTTDEIINPNGLLASTILELTLNRKISYNKIMDPVAGSNSDQGANLITSPSDMPLAVDIEKGILYEKSLDGLIKLGKFQIEELLQVDPFGNIEFGGFYSYSNLREFLKPGDGREVISIDGEFVDGKESVYFDQSVDIIYKDPFSTLEKVESSQTTLSKLEGNFSIIEVVVIDLEDPEIPDLMEPGKEIAGLIIEGVRKNKIQNLFHDPLFEETLTKESFLGEMAVRDWELEEEYANIPYWDDDESYEARDKIIVSDTVYISEADFNRGNDPENFGGGFWKIDKILSNTETYKNEEFNLLYLVYEKIFDAKGQVINRKVIGLQPVVGIRYSVEDKAITPGFIPIEECKQILTVQTESDGKVLSYFDVLTQNNLSGIPVFSGHIRHK